MTFKIAFNLEFNSWTFLLFHHKTLIKWQHRVLFFRIPIWVINIFFIFLFSDRFFSFFYFYFFAMRCDRVKLYLEMIILRFVRAMARTCSTGKCTSFVGRWCLINILNIILKVISTWRESRRSNGISWKNAMESWADFSSFDDTLSDKTGLFFFSLLYLKINDTVWVRHATQAENKWKQKEEENWS